MALANHLSEHGTTIVNVYNLVDRAVRAQTVRDSVGEHGITVDPVLLENNLKDLILRGSEPVSLEQIKQGYTPARSFHLQLCDGYKLPHRFMSFINDMGLPASFSIAADLVGDDKPSWTNKAEIAIQQVLDQLDGGTIQFSLSNIGIEGDLSFFDIQSGRALRNTLKDARPEGMDGDVFVEEICTSLSKASGLQIAPTLVSDSVFDRKMTWQDVRNLVEDKYEIVTHGAKHTLKFTEMSSDNIISDILSARMIFNKEAGVTPSALTYPEGAYDDRVVRAVKEAGINMALHMGKYSEDDKKRGLNDDIHTYVDRQTDRMAVSRVAADHPMLLGLAA